MKVTVLVITYNHEKFIAQAISSILVQQTNFDYEVVIIEDCSTDSTRDIVVDFQKKHPNRIRLVLSEENKCDNKDLVTEIQAAHGQYVALLDGDDYWTSPYKLQKQVDFLDNHPECVTCFHNVMAFKDEDPRVSWNYNAADQSEFSELEDLLSFNFIATCSVMFRKSVIGKFPNCLYSLTLFDWAFHILNAQHGKVGYINELMGAYRIHKGGIASSMTRDQHLQERIKMYECVNPALNFKYDTFIKSTIYKYYDELAVESNDRNELFQRIREIVRNVLPTDAAVIVVSERDVDLLTMDGRRWWLLPQTENSQSEILFARAAEGSEATPWIRTGAVYEFRLYAGTERQKRLATVRFTWNEGATIMAIPKLESAGDRLRATTITWSTGNDLDGQVYVSENGGPETLFAKGSKGSQLVRWIRTGTMYEFRLYAGTERQKRLATVRFTWNEGAMIAVSSPQFSAGIALGTTIIDWTTGDGAEGEVYVAESEAILQYPASSAEAISQLETLRAKGGDFLLFPSTALWWFEHYQEFKQHLERHYRVVVRQEDTCVIFALRQPSANQ